MDRLVDELAKPAVAAPVTLTTDKGSVTIPPTAIARSLRFSADEAGKLIPRVDVKRLRTALGDRLAKIEVAPKDAGLTIAGGKPKVVPGRPASSWTPPRSAGTCWPSCPRRTAGRSPASSSRRSPS